MTVVDPSSPTDAGRAPAGTSRAFAVLLTDLVDSTALTGRLGDAEAARLFAEHDRAARDLLPVHGGREIDKSDGFLCLFADVAGAASFAAAYHAALRALATRWRQPLRARAGIHWAPLQLRENHASDVARGAKPLDVDGIGKATAARVMAVAGAGGTLLTAAAAQALPGAGRALRSCGFWQVKGVPQPLELFEPVGHDMAGAMPEEGDKAHRVHRVGDHWRPLREVPHNLAAERDSFIGRAGELDALAGAFAGGARLVSLLGMGGVGKTRLAQRFAALRLADHPGGSWFCDLSSAHDEGALVAAVVGALDLQLGPGDPLVQLGHAMAARGRCLFVLDNAEQITPAVAQALGRWLDRAPLARFLVTTRSLLGVAGEQVVPLEPPPAAEAQALFMARAAAAAPQREWDEAARDDVRRLVELLDRLPLAIELAAARLRLMSPGAMLARMGERFRVLVAPGARAGRQATLRATLDWSWELLDDDERSALAQLSVFEGGFTLDAAEAVLALTGAWPPDAVQALAEKSWVYRASAERLALRVSVKEYAADRLTQHAGGAGMAATRQRHAEHYATMGEPARLFRAQVLGTATGLRALAAECDNLLAACHAAQAAGQGRIAVQALSAACEVFELQGSASRGEALARGVLVLSLQPAERAAALLALARALNVAGRLTQSEAPARDALALAQQCGDAALACRAQLFVARLLRLTGRQDEARASLHDLEARAESGGDLRALCQARLELAALHPGGMAHALTAYDEVIAQARQLGDRRIEATAAQSRAAILRHTGQLALAREGLQEAQALVRELGDRRAECRLHEQFGLLEGESGQLEAASRHFHAGLAVARACGDRRMEGSLLGMVGLVQGAMQQLDDALRTLSEALVLHREVGAEPEEGSVLGRLGEIHRLRGEPAQAEAWFTAGEQLLRRLGDEGRLAYLLADRVQLAADVGDFATLRQTLAELRALAERLGASASGELAQVIAAMDRRLAAADGAPAKV